MVTVWLGGVVVWAMDMQSLGYSFSSCASATKQC